jgi:hypothetical protein
MAGNYRPISGAVRSRWRRRAGFMGGSVAQRAGFAS